MEHHKMSKILPAGFRPIKDLLKLAIDKASFATKGGSGKQGTPLLHLCALGVL